MSRMLFAALALAASALLPQPALAWGQRAHDAIDRAAIEALPDDGPIFLRAYADYIAASATIPDSWRSPSEPFAKIEEDPNHGWYREQFAFLARIPRSRYEFILALHNAYLEIKDRDPDAARRMNVHWAGTLPYAVMEQYGHLVADMRLLRAARAEGRTEKARFLEQTCAFIVVRLGHYVADGSQPLHDSINSEGWRGPNPQGYTREASVHLRFERDYVDAIGLTEAEVRRNMGPIAHLESDLFDQLLSYLDRNSERTEEVFQLDKRGAFADRDDLPAHRLVYQQTSAGASMLRDLLYRAWLESDRKVPAGLRNPADPSNPLYNGETGSEPAPKQPASK